MTLRIHTNLLALRATNGLERTTRQIDRHLRHIGSGLRITTAADDPQGLARAERLHARVLSNNMAARGVENAIGLVRTIESGLARMSEVGVRLRELAILASNGTASPRDIATYDAERLGLAEELSRIASSTRYNGKAVLSEQETIALRVGVDPQDVLGLDLMDFTPVGLVFAYYSLADEEEGREQIHEYSGVLIDALSGLRGFLGGLENRLSSILRGLRVSEENLSASESLIRDADLAAEISDLRRARVREALGLLLVVQANVNHDLARELLDDIGAVDPAPPVEEEEDGTEKEEQTPFGLDPPETTS